MIRKVVFLRHGQSVWNKENKFTGWADVDLSPQGEKEARKAGQLLSKAGLTFDYSYCSVLKRAIKTLWLSLEELNIHWIPQELSWRLNERHYGALEGLDKIETAKNYGTSKVGKWRRSFDTPPPELPEGDVRIPKKDSRYKTIDPNVLPKTECLKDTIDRVLPFWQNVIVPRALNNERLLIVSHGNTLRGLIKEIDGISENEIVNLNIPTGLPLVYEFENDMRPVTNYYLGDPEEAKLAAEKVANQSKFDE